MTNWSPQQIDALNKVKEWLQSDRKIFRLFGYAGTGKTTLAMHLAEQADGVVQFAAFTGKAANVMMKKGMANACTLHSIVYKATLNRETGLYEYKWDDASILQTCDLLVIDEVSMVNEELAEDIMKFPMKILVLGDPFQLPPVKGTGFFTDAKPDHMLTEIHRQALDNPIIRLSSIIRDEDGFYQDETFDGENVIMLRKKDDIKEYVMGADQVIVGRNKTRELYNARMRHLLGYQGGHPNVGERIICLRNRSSKMIYNGALYEVKDVKHSGYPGCRCYIIKDVDSHHHIEVDVHDDWWRGAGHELHYSVTMETEQFDYGYCLTGHKSQGSQWNKVCLFNESFCFGKMARRWLYTCVTRAAEQIVIIE